MSMIKAKVGELLSVSLQAFNGAEDLYPQAIVRDTAGAVLATIDLSHVGDGLYVNRTFLMPNFVIVTTQYKVYTDSDHTVLHEDYQDGLDVYVKDDPLTSALISDGTIFGLVQDTDELYGVVEDILIDNDLIGFIEDSDMVGLVEADELIGILEGDSLVGVISCSE